MDALKAYPAASWPKGKDIREAMFNLSEKYSSYVPKLSEAVRTKVEGLLKLRLEGPQTKEGQEEEIVADAAAEAEIVAEAKAEADGMEKPKPKRIRGKQTQGVSLQPVKKGKQRGAKRTAGSFAMKANAAKAAKKQKKDATETPPVGIIK